MYHVWFPNQENAVLMPLGQIKNALFEVPRVVNTYKKQKRKKLQLNDVRRAFDMERGIAHYRVFR